MIRDIVEYMATHGKFKLVGASIDANSPEIVAQVNFLTCVINNNQNDNSRASYIGLCMSPLPFVHYI
jgi:hypothetical protein